MGNSTSVVFDSRSEFCLLRQWGNKGMLYDRPYMRKEEFQQGSPVLKWVLLINLGVFITQCVAERWFRSEIISDIFALAGSHLLRGQLWVILSYSFLHSTGFLLHIIGNLLVIFFIGRALQPVLGGQKLLALYLGSALLGAIFWLSFNFRSGQVIGASAAALGLLTTFCLMYPDRAIQVLLFFIIPVTVKPRYLCWIVLGIELFGFLFLEISPGGVRSNVAHSAHLGGMLGGWVFFRYFLHRPSLFERRKPAVEAPAWYLRNPPTASSGPRFRINIRNRRQLQVEVDRILDKINTNGFGSLSKDEQRTLDKAKDILRR